MIPAGCVEYLTASIARQVGALVADGMPYDDALVEACLATPAGLLIAAAREEHEAGVATLLGEIAAKDLAPRLPISYDGYLDAIVELCGEEHDRLWPRLAELARFEEEPDAGQPFVVRGGLVERRPS